MHTGQLCNTPIHAAPGQVHTRPRTLGVLSGGSSGNVRHLEDGEAVRRGVQRCTEHHRGAAHQPQQPRDAS